MKTVSRPIGWPKVNPKPNLYKNKKHEIDGIVFASEKEGRRYGMLKQLQKSGYIQSFELQPRFDYVIQYHANGRVYSKKAHYKADFAVKQNDGSIVIEDVKGMRTEEYKRKKKIVEALYLIEIIEK